MYTPNCIAIIPDGNRTWAQKLGMSGLLGHDQGLKQAQEVVDSAFAAGVRHVVFWAASEANLQKRSKEEIGHLFELLKKELKRRLADDDGVRFRLVGQWQQHTADAELAELVEKAEQKTAGYNEKQFTVLFGYSGKAELLRAVAQMRETNEDVTDANFEKYLATGFVPQADFVIRTGVRGDPHWSDWFLFWQTGNSQLYFTETPWPAFGKKELTQALEDYRKRQRRLGA